MENQNKTENLEKWLTIGIMLLLTIISIYSAFFIPEFSYDISSSGDIITENSKENKKEKQNGKININTATESQLVDALTGVGPAIAKRIIIYRESKGGFSSVNELMNIKGIGPKIFNKIKDDITV